MPRRHTILVAAIALFIPASALAASNLAQYPLRVHVYERNEHNHYANGRLQSVEGEGRANLFANGQPHGLDFNFRCEDSLMTSSGWETYPARWKKKDQILELLYPVMGKPGAMHPCELKVTMKNFAYYRRSGSLYTEPADVFKQWMDKHHYDPEHGKNQPTDLQPSDSAPRLRPVPAKPTPQ